MTASNLSQKILAKRLGGYFDAASFYRAKQKGYSDRDIVAAINANPELATGQLKFIAQNYEKALAQTGPSRHNKDVGPSWGPQLMITPNKYNPLLGGRDPYGGRFSGEMSGDDPGQAFAKRGMSFSYGTPNAQKYLNEQYWTGQVNTNPEVNYRWNTGDQLDPEIDIDNQYGRLAQMDLSGRGGSEEYKKLARERAKAYDTQGASGTNKWGSMYLHESDPRYAAVTQNEAEAYKYLTETDPSVGSSEAARWIERALSGEVMTPMTAGQSAISTGAQKPAATGKFGNTGFIPKEGSALAGSNVKAAIREVAQRGADPNRIGVKGASQLVETQGAKAAKKALKQERKGKITLTNKARKALQKAKKKQKFGIS